MPVLRICADRSGAGLVALGRQCRPCRRGHGCLRAVRAGVADAVSGTTGAGSLLSVMPPRLVCRRPGVPQASRTAAARGERCYIFGTVPEM